MTAGYLNIANNYLPKGLWLNVILSAVLMVLMTLVFLEAFWKWYELLRVQVQVKDKHGDLVLAEVEE